MPRRVLLYTRGDCHLCHRAEQILRAIAADYPELDVEVRDVDADAVARARFGHHVPVIALDGQVVAAGRVSEFRLRRELGILPRPRPVLGLVRAALRRS